MIRDSNSEELDQGRTRFDRERADNEKREYEAECLEWASGVVKAKTRYVATLWAPEMSTNLELSLYHATVVVDAHLVALNLLGGGQFALPEMRSTEADALVGKLRGGETLTFESGAGSEVIVPVGSVLYAERRSEYRHLDD